MADTPTSNNLNDEFELNKNILDIQAKIGEKLLLQEKSMYKIIGMDKDIVRGTIERWHRQRDIVRDLQQEQERLIQYESDTAHLTGEDMKKAKINIASYKQEISKLETELKTIQAYNKLAWIPYLYSLKKSWDLFKGMDASAEKFRMKMGMIRQNVNNIQITARKLAIDFMHLGVGIDGAYDAITALGKEMGSIHIASKNLIVTTALLKSQLGVAEEVSAGFFRNMAAVSKTTMASQQNIAYFAQDLSAAAGVPFPEVMHDIAKMSGVTLSMISKVPSQIVKAAIEAKMMNTTLEKMAASGREILNFTESVNAEMEASVLLGRSINLQRARELAYRKDIVGSTKEILRITKQIDFSNLDVFQQEAFAKATGKGVDELLNMVQAEKEWDNARRSADPAIQKQIAEYDRLRMLNEDGAKARGRDVEMMVRQAANQQRITQLTNKWNQVLAKSFEVMIPIFDGLLSIAPVVIDIGTGLMKVYGVVVGIGELLAFGSLQFAVWSEKITKISNIFLAFGSFGEKILSVVGRVTGFFAKWGATIVEFFPYLARLGPLFKTVLGPLSIIITGFQLLSSFVRRMEGFGEALKNQEWGKAFVIGIKAIGGALFDVIVQPFIDVKDWILDKLGWGGHSPSLVGLSILKGISSIGSMMFNALVSPFVSAWNWLSGNSGLAGHSSSDMGDLIVKGIVSSQSSIYNGIVDPFKDAFKWLQSNTPSVGKMLDKVNVGTNATEVRAMNTYIPAVTITPEATKLNPDLKNTYTPEVATGNKSLDELIAVEKENGCKLDALIELLKAGKIQTSVNMDGQLLSATLARQTEFRGGYGVNKI